MATNANKVTLPNNETIWENYVDDTGEIRYVIATKDQRIRDTYILFCREGEGWKKVKTSSSPEKLQKFIRM